MIEIESRSCVTCVHYDPENNLCLLPVEWGEKPKKVPSTMSCAFDNKRSIWYFGDREVRL